MQIETHDELLLDEVRSGFEQARDDVLGEAQRLAARHSQSGKYERSLETTGVSEQDGRLVAHVGSPLASATARERGAFIRPREAKWLMFVGREGHLVKVASVRLPKHPVVAPAGRRFGEFLLARLREARVR